MTRPTITLILTGLGRIGDHVSADPEDPANYDLFAGLVEMAMIDGLYT